MKKYYSNSNKNDLKYSKMPEGNTCIVKANLAVLPLT